MRTGNPAYTLCRLPECLFSAMFVGGINEWRATIFVLMDARVLQEQIDGIGRYAVCVMQALSKSRPTWKLSAIVSSRARKHLDGFPVETVISNTPRFRPGREKELTGIINQTGADLFLNFSMAGPCSQLPTAITVHDLMVLNFPGYFGPGMTRNFLARLIFRRLLQRSIAHAALVSVPSEATRQEFENTFPGAAHKVFVAGEGQNLFSPGAAIERGREDYLLYVGNARAYKNLSRLIVAYSRLKALGGDIPDMTMVVRRDRAFSAFMREVESSSARKSITVLTDASDGELACLYTGCMAFIMPSLHEGFGLPALEAMASGAPIIVSEGTALEELAGDAGITVNPLSVTDIMKGIALVVSDPALRQTMSRRSAARATGFSWKTTANIIATNLERIAE